MSRYLTAEARPTYATPPWAREADIEERFTAVQQLDEHPFAYRDNLIYVLSTDLFTGTEILQALIERRYLSEDELTSTRREIEDIWVTYVRSEKMFGIFIKDHVNNKPIRQDMKNCIKTLKQLLVKFEIKSLGIIKDLGMLSKTEWSFFVDQINKVCR